MSDKIQTSTTGRVTPFLQQKIGLSMNFEAVTARYIDVRLERKKEVLDAYHNAAWKTRSPKEEKLRGSAAGGVKKVDKARRKVIK